MTSRCAAWLAVALAFAVAACGLRDRSVKIAVAVPLTGDVGTEGQGVKRAVELAVAQANESHKYPYQIEVVAFDDRGDPKEANNVANLISSDPSIVAVVGHYNSNCCIPAAQVYNRVHLVMVSPACTNPKVTDQQLEPSWTGPRTVFRVVPTDDVQGPYAADFAYQRMGFKRFAVLHDKTAYGQGLADAFADQLRKDGGTVVSEDGITIGDKDFKALLTRLKSEGPDGVYFGGLYTEAGLLLKQMKEVGLKASFFSGDGAMTPSLFDVAGDAADGAYLSITGVPVEDLPTAKTFLKQYHERFPGAEVKPFDHFGYESANVILAALLQSGPDRDRLREVLRAIHYEGILGTVSFDEKGDVLSKIITMTRAKAAGRTFTDVVWTAPPSAPSGATGKVAGSSGGTSTSTAVPPSQPSPTRGEGERKGMFLQQLVNGLVLGAIYSLIALGYTLVYGILMMINFAHSEIFMMGAFMGLGADMLLPAGTGWFAAIVVFLAGMLGAGTLGVLTERLAYRPLRKASALAPLISAIGVSIILQNAVFLWLTNATVPFPQLLPVIPWGVAGVTFTSQDLLIFVTAIVLMLALHFFTQKTKMGKAMRACADSVETAGLMGIDANLIIAMTFFIGGALGGAAGLLYGMNYGSIKYNLGFMPGVKAFTAAVLGGIGNIAGSVLGGFLLGLIEVMASAYLPGGNEWKDVFAFVVLIAVLLIRPSGLLGEKVADKV